MRSLGSSSFQRRDPADDCRMHALGRNVAPVLALELGLVLFAMAPEHRDARDDQSHRQQQRNDEQKRARDALQLGLPLPARLLFHDAVPLARGMGLCRRDKWGPRGRKRNAHLRERARLYPGDRVGDRPIVVEGHAAGQVAMTVGNDIAAARNRLPRRHWQRECRVDVVRVDIPALGDELPVQDAAVVVSIDRVRVGVVEHERLGGVGGIAECIERLLLAVVRVVPATGTARRAPRRIERDLGQAAAGSVCIDHGDAVDDYRARLRRVENRRRQRIGAGELVFARIHHVQASVFCDARIYRVRDALMTFRRAARRAIRKLIVENAHADEGHDYHHNDDDEYAPAGHLVLLAPHSTPPLYPVGNLAEKRR